MNRSILKRPTVEAITGLSCTSLYRKMKSGEFPSPVRIGKRAVGWNSEAVQAWIDARIDESESSSNAHAA